MSTFEEKQVFVGEETMETTDKFEAALKLAILAGCIIFSSGVSNKRKSIYFVTGILLQFILNEAILFV